ncbi:MAG: hypothetical protein MJ135_05250 [Oscillospiraceae bacterium]|nr:hypothetical protein [Oscillospiraceae bacterium]
MFSFDMVQSGLVVLILMAVGDILSKKLKAIMPSILISGVIYLGLMWSGILPTDLVQSSGFSAMVSIAMSFIILGMGASTNFAELKANIRVVALSALVFFVQVISILVIMNLIYDRNMALAALPGGSNVALIVQARARELGYDNIIVLTVLLISFKGLVSSPIVSLAMRREVARLIRNPQEMALSTAPVAAPSAAEEAPARPGILGSLFYKGPCRKTEGFYRILIRMYVVVWIAARLELLTGLSRYVFCLLLGVLFTELGFLHRDDMQRSGVNDFMMLLLMSTIIGGFSSATPQMLAELAVPLAIVMGIDIVFITLFSVLLAKPFGFSPALAIAFGFQGMMGFPLNMLLTRDVVSTLTDDPDLTEKLNSHLVPRIVLAGFTSTTVLSVIVAGVLIGFMV